MIRTASGATLLARRNSGTPAITGIRMSATITGRCAWVRDLAGQAVEHGRA